MAQSVGRQTLDFGLGCDLGVMELSPTWGSVLGRESAWDSFPLPVQCMCPLSVSLSLSNKS